jgi:hypothetical protein
MGGLGVDPMIDDIVAVLIPLVAIAIIFAWVPFLNLICPPRERSLELVSSTSHAPTYRF